jgi:cellulose synthase operon protein C
VWLCAVLFFLVTWCCNACATSTKPNLPEGFLRYPPYNGFDFEAINLLPAPHDGLIDVELQDLDMRNVRPSSTWVPYPDLLKKIAEADYDGVPSNLRSEVQAMRASPNGDAAYAAGKDLPVSVRMYIAGAMDFRVAHPNGVDPYKGPVPDSSAPADKATVAEKKAALDRAILRFETLLKLPDDQKRPRGVAAAYMLGRSLVLRGANGDDANAEDAFVLTRILAKQGMPDPQGLAVSSFGEQAHLVRARGDVPGAVELYAEQASHQSTQGVASLKWVAQALYDDAISMSNAEHQPLVQKILVAYALAINDNGDIDQLVYTNYTDAYTSHPASPALYNMSGIKPILDTAKTWPASDIAAPDHLAALAYRVNDLAFARKLLVGQNSALAWWLRAKLDLADGKLQSAEHALAQARRLTSSGTSTNTASGLSDFNVDGICTELTQLERARGEFELALSNILACERQHSFIDNRGEADYIANDILTTPELIAFVDSHTTGKADDAAGNGLRSVLAMRLIREGRIHLALRYAEPQGGDYVDGLSQDGPEKSRSQLQLLKDYVSAKDEIANGTSRIARAQAWYTIALLTRVHYYGIFGGDPDLAHRGKPAYQFSGVSPAEVARVTALSRVQYLHDTHWYAAYDEALKASQLVPPRSQAYAAILCHAAHWMHQAPSVDNHDPTAAFAYTYRLYVKHGAYVPWANKFGQICPQPDFQRAARLGWKKYASR